MEITLPDDSYVESVLMSMALNSLVAAGEIFSETDMEDYYSPRYRLLFSVCKGLYEKNSPLDINLIFSEIKTRGMLHEISYENLISIFQVPVSSSVCEEFIEKLKTLSGFRRVIYAARTALSEASMKGKGAKSEELDEIISACQDKLVKAKGNDLIRSKEIKNLVDNFSNGMSFDSYVDYRIGRKRQGFPPYEGISSGYKILDETLGYFRNGCIYYIGARTSMGKTTFLLNLMNNMKDKSIGFFSLEMPHNIVFEKFVCLAADIKYSEYEDVNLVQENIERLKEISKQFKKRDIRIEDPSSITISQLRAMAKRMKTEDGIEILFIDYLTRIRGGKHANKHLEVDEISKGLQTLAKELEIPVVCLAQLNRQSAKADANEKVKEPTLTDFRESGSIEEDADACILLHRPDYYNKTDFPGVIYVKVVKNRLRGILKRIEFSCRSNNSERYFEERSYQEQVREIQNQECDYIMSQI